MNSPAIPLLAANTFSLKTPFRTPLDVPILLFLLSGMIGYWASYDPAASLPKLLMLLGAVVIYYSIIALRMAPRLFSPALWLYVLGGAGASLYFIAETNFAAAPTKLEMLARLGASLDAILPHVAMPAPNPNLAAGTLEFVFPFTLFSALHFAKQRAWFQAAVAALCSLILLLGVLLTTSRGAWLANGVIFGTVGIGYAVLMLGRRAKIARNEQSRRVVIALSVVIFIAAFALLVSQFANISDALRANSALAPRVELYKQTWELIQEYPFTGAGLGVFSLVYSAYVMLIDAPLLPHAHNIFLAVWIEQGILGGAALAWLIIAFAWWGWRNRHALNWIGWASFVAIGIWLVHGLVDVPIYGSHALPLLFVPFAFAIAGGASSQSQAAQVSVSKATTPRVRYLQVAVVVLMFGFLALGWKQVLSTCYANLGAVVQTKAELALYRPNKPPIEIHSIMNIRRIRTTALDDAEKLYLQALALNPSNQVAQRRLGLIALARREMNSAVGYLSAAWQAHPSNRATRKALGYAYAWSGNSDKAAALLEPFPETRLELWDDTWWWRLQGRPDLAYQAGKIIYLAPVTRWIVVRR